MEYKKQFEQWLSEGPEKKKYKNNIPYHKYTLIRRYLWMEYFFYCLRF